MAVTCKGDAEVLTQVKRGLEGLKLTLNDTKTRIVDAKQENSVPWGGRNA